MGEISPISRSCRGLLRGGPSLLHRGRRGGGNRSVGHLVNVEGKRTGSHLALGYHGNLIGKFPSCGGTAHQFVPPVFVLVSAGRNMASR